MAFHFSLARKNTLSVGIDLGVDAAKIICLQWSNTGYKLMAHALVRREHVNSIKEFLHHSSIKKADVRIAISVPQLKMQRLAVPNVPADELEQVVAWSFKETANLPIEEYVIRFHRVRGELQSAKQHVMAFAVEKPHLAQWRKFIADAGIDNPSVAEPDIQSLANVVAFNYNLKEDDRYAIIDIGRTQSQLAVVSLDGIEFYRPFSGIGGDHLTSSISSEMGISEKEAEDAVMEASSEIKGEKQDQVREIIDRYCAKFCVQTQYAVENYSTASKDKPITNIVLAGGGAKLMGLKEQIQDTLHHPTDLINPFSKLDLGRFKEAEFDNFKTLYAVAAGLAL